MKPILVIKIKDDMSPEIGERIKEWVNKNIGDIPLLISGSNEHNSIYLLTGKKTKFKKQIINKILNL